jgi:hypothetical protein
MTVEIKTTLQPSDVITVEFECAQCHSMTSWPLGVAKHPPMKCHCSDQQWMTLGGETYCAITDIIALLQRFSKARKEPFVMRFGIRHDPALGRASESKA